MPESKLIWRERRSSLRYVESVWTCSTPAIAARTVIADPCISLALVKDSSGTKVVLRGPRTKPHYVLLPAGYSCTTIRLKPGVFLKGFPIEELIDKSRVIPANPRSQFWIGELRLQFPAFDYAEQLIDELHGLGYLEYEVVDSEQTQGQSSRTYSRQIRRTTGLSPYRLYQLRRIHQALRLMKQGMTAVEVASELDFVDQSHLTRASKQFFGRTPSQLLELPQTP